MLSTYILCLLVGFAAASDYAWKGDTEYHYDVRGRTLAGLHQVDDQFAGIVLRAQLTVRPKRENVLVARLHEPKYAPLHAKLPGGWAAPIPDSMLNFRPMQLQNRPFIIKLKNGTVQELIVDRQTPNPETNIIKSIVSQLQVDVQGENMIKSRYNRPTTHNWPNSAEFKVMEDTVTGKCETLYDINELPEYLLQTHPELAPLPHLKADGDYIDVVKTQNSTNCNERPVYNFGLMAMEDWEAASASYGDFFAKSSVSRIILSGTVKRHTIQSSVTTNKILVKPTPGSNQKGLVVSRMNITLTSVKPASGQPEEPSEPKSVGNLVYRYDNPYSSVHDAREGQRNSEEHKYDSSSSSSSSQQYADNEEDNRSTRFSRHRRSLNQRRRQYNELDESSSSSSSSNSVENDDENLQEKPTMTSPPEIPLLPFTVGYNGKSIKSAPNVNIVQLVQKIAIQIGRELEEPGQLSMQDTLGKYNMLTKLIHTMSYKELQEASHELYNQKSKDNRHKNDAWKTFRDAVAETGTGPALLTIKDWIEHDKITHMEAATSIAKAANAACTPTDEYMRTFYKLVTDDKLSDKDSTYLRDTAILSFTNLVRKVYVNKYDSHIQYPDHVFGNFYQQNPQVVVNEYIPYFERKLREAIQSADSVDIQLYIRALGNIGHRKILAVFEPYLEGEKQVSQFQRLLMIISLDKLVHNHPKTARVVLYNVYQNEGEATEVRVAAVYQLMRTGPPASMLQRMAQATHVDSSEDVSSAVKSAIESASKLRHPDHQQLAMNAQSAVHLLNPKEFGFQYSKQHLVDYVVKEMNIAYEMQTGYIGSEDSIIPQGVMFTLRGNRGDVKSPFTRFFGLVSSVEDLFQVLEDQTVKDDILNREGSKQHSEWAADPISKFLKMKYEEREQLEGHMHLAMTGGLQAFYAFDNQTIQELPKFVKEMSEKLRRGKEFNITQFYTSVEMTLSFPTAMGIPFVYTLDTPSVLTLNGEISAKSKPEIVTSHSGKEKLQAPEYVNVTADIRFVLASKVQAKLGFITPFDHQHYIAGFDKKAQIYLPLRAKIDIDVENEDVSIELQPLDNQSDDIFHYGTWPYTAKHDILDFKPVSTSSSAKIIHIREPQIFDEIIGKKQGMAFRVKAKTERKFVDYQALYEMCHRHEGFSKILSPWFEDTLIYTNVSVQYKDDLSHADSVTFLMGWNQTYFSGKAKSSDPDFDQTYSQASKAEDNDYRQEYFLKKAAAGINNADASVFDLSVQFSGQQYHAYNATLAIGKSTVDKKSRVLFYYTKDATNDKNFETCFFAQSEFPNTNGLDFIYALKFDPTSHSEMKLAYGERCIPGTKINLKAKLEKTEERKRYLQEHPMAKQCVEEMHRGDEQLFACRNMTVRANFFDHYEFDIKYENMKLEARNFTHKWYSFARYLGYNYLDENLLEGHGKSNEISIEAQFEPDFKSVNISVETEKMQDDFNNVRVHPWTRAVVAVHPVFTVADRLNGYAQNLALNPTCVVDKKRVETFDNRTYPINLGKTWHVQMLYREQKAARHQEHDKKERFHNDDDFDYVILVRDAGNDKKDVKLVINDEKNYYEIDMIPAEGSSHSGSHPAAQVLINQQRIQFDDKHAFDLDEDLLSVYALPNGEVKVEINNDLYIIYDGERNKITTLTDGDKFRDELRGLCGNFDGEKVNEFLTPRLCILRDPEAFADSYAISDSSAQGSAKEYHQHGESSQCYREEMIYANVISRQDYETRRNSPHEYRSQKQQYHSSSSSSSSCSKQQTQYAEEDNGETLCFSIRPLPVCRPGCSADKKVVKNVEVHCVRKNNVSELWKKQIEKGASPDFSLKSASKTIKMKVPQSCSS